MSQQILEMVEKSSLKAEVPEFNIGDVVDVHTKILEGDKERIQIFSGVVIARSGSGTREMFTVRRLVGEEGVAFASPLDGRSARAGAYAQVSDDEMRGMRSYQEKAYSLVTSPAAKASIVAVASGSAARNEKPFNLTKSAAARNPARLFPSTKG